MDRRVATRPVHSSRKSDWEAADRPPTHIPFEGSLCKNCNTLIEPQESHEKRGHDEAILTCVDTDTT